MHIHNCGYALSNCTLRKLYFKRELKKYLGSVKNV